MTKNLTHGNARQTHGVCSDLIRRQAAIDALGDEPDVWTDTEEEWAYRNAWVEHISAIKSLPSAEDFKLALDEWEAEHHWDDKEQHDLISRQDVIIALDKSGLCYNNWLEVRNEIEAVPSADRPTGEWVRKYDKHINCYWYECNQCGEDRPRNVFGKEWSSPYCPNCGAKMTGGEDSD